MFERRLFLGGLLSVFSGPFDMCACNAQSPQAPHTLGCILAASDVSGVYPKNTPTTSAASTDAILLGSSGDRDFDKALAITLSRCVDVLGVLPGIAFFNDSASPNAYATNEIRLARADGTVLLGKTLLMQLLSSIEAPDACVAMICAHEFGHILQFKHGLNERLLRGQRTVKRVELQADFFAGYFAGIRKRERPNFPAAVFASTALRFGDHFTNHHSHHGTPAERADAVVRGFKSAYEERASLSEAIEISMRYLAAT